ncbi:MAG: DUF4226 domain-containing protein [Mycobacterium sp.]
MTTIDDVIATIKHVTQCTGDPNAWLTGLSGDELDAARTILTAGPQRLDALLSTIRRHHPDLFGAVADRQEGDAADAIRDAEAALAHQGSATAQLDLQVIAAILNAHQRTIDGGEALDKLQQDVEAAVRARTDLYTPAGARDFLRFLIGKLGEMRAVLANANLDDTSKSVLMAALTSLYSSSKERPGDGKPDRPVDPPPGDGQSPEVSPDSGTDPYLDALPADDPGMVTGGASTQNPAPMSSAIPALPNPGGAAAPGPAPGWGSPGGLTLPSLPTGGGMERALRVPDDAELESDEPADQQSPEVGDDDTAGAGGGEPAPAPEPPTGPTTVTLPNGEMVTAASRELAAVIKAAADGTPIADAFRQQGITIPPPGTAVADPVDPFQLQPGDIGMFTTRHALALGHSEALVDGQIQHISAVTGPSFLGWEHPPVPVTIGAPATTDRPVPTRPAAVAAAAQ